MEREENMIHPSLLNAAYCHAKQFSEHLKYRIVGRIYGWYLFFCLVLSKIRYQSSHKDDDLIIIYGSQTGTAEEYAFQTSSRLKKLNVHHSVWDATLLDKYHFQKNAVFVFIVSTCGIGEPPDNIRHVFRMLQEYSLYGIRSPTRHIIFGIGDTSYESYNEAAKSLSRLLHNVHSRPVLPLTLADTARRLDLTFQNWMSVLVKSLSPGKEPHCADLREQVVRGNLNEAFLYGGSTADQKRPSLMHTRVETSELLTPGSTTTTRLIRFSLPDDVISYEPGDHVACYSPNSALMVNELIEALSLTDNELQLPVADFLSVEGTVTSPRCSVYLYLKWHADLHRRLAPEDFQLLVQYVRDTREQIQLEQSLGKEKKADGRATWLTVFREYPSLFMRLRDFLFIIPQKFPRLYSVCNFRSVDPCLSIAVTAVDGGQCSNWLCSLKAGDTVPLCIRPSEFRVSFQDFERDVLFVGTGTGIAPFMGFLQKKHFWKHGQIKADVKMSKIRRKNAQYTSTAIRPAGKLALIFGCRTAREWLFADRLRRIQDCESTNFEYKDIYQPQSKIGNISYPVINPVNSFVLDSVYAAFSREHPYERVQNRIKDIAEDVWKLVSSKGIIFICGDAAKMCQDVEESLVEHVFAPFGGHSLEKARDFLEDLKQAKLIRRDVWDTS